MDITDIAGTIEAARLADKELGGIDVLVNNAVYQGPGSEKRVLDLQLQDFTKMSRANVEAQLALVQTLLPGMLQRGRGSIVQLVSSSSNMKPTRAVGSGGWDFGYAATKSAISKLVPLLAVEHPLEQSGLRFFNVEPGLVVTEVMKAKGTAATFRQFGDEPPEATGAAVAHLVGAPAKDVNKYNGAPFVFAPKLAADMGLLPGYTYQDKMNYVKSDPSPSAASNKDSKHPYPPEELHRAYARYTEVKDRCSRTRDWNEFADLFTEDCFYVEHGYGEFHGREAVRDDYIVKVMKPWPDMTFPHDWHIFDYERGAVIVMVQNALPPPYNMQSGKPFSIPNISRLVYGGNGLWKEQQDWYNPQLYAPKIVKAWRTAGGRFQSEEALKLKHDKSSKL